MCSMSNYIRGYDDNFVLVIRPIVGLSASWRGNYHGCAKRINIWIFLFFCIAIWGYVCSHGSIVKVCSVTTNLSLIIIISYFWFDLYFTNFCSWTQFYFLFITFCLSSSSFLELPYLIKTRNVKFCISHWLLGAQNMI